MMMLMMMMMMAIVPMFCLLPVADILDRYVCSSSASCSDAPATYLEGSTKTV